MLLNRGSSAEWNSSDQVAVSPDKQEKATLTVLEQAEVLSKEWAA